MPDDTELVLCSLDEIPTNGMRQFEVDGKSVLVCRTDGNIHAVDGVCPHRGAQLGSGTLDGTTVVCPWHDWAFDVESGCGLTNPMSNLDRYAVSVRDDKVIVVIPDK